MFAVASTRLSARRPVSSKGSPLPTVDRLDRLKELFFQASEMDTEGRQRLLDALPAEDADLKDELVALLSSDRTVEIGALELAQRSAEDASPGPAGRRIGAYRLVRLLGEGGMGAVYLAERADEAYRQQVAVKMARSGGLTEEGKRRFSRERQALAQLQHPHVSRLLDGGVTEDGAPYLVMEYVDGMHIDQYCREHALSVRQRLLLFEAVCQAVSHAHRNLVVHRDLKPSNVLVDREGQVKLLDFGIAKLLDADETGSAADPTLTTEMALTPEFASPEQFRGETVTTASDVYSLGVMLYLLLTDEKPHARKTASLVDFARIVSDTEPPPPSARAFASSSPSVKKQGRALEGDLDNIVLMALRKEPERRYASVEQLAEDIRRHEDGRPVLARKDTLGYRTEKFVKRHKAAVAGAVLVLLSLIAGIVATAWQARVAEAERAKAEQRFGELRKLAGSLVFQLHDEIAELPGSTPARNTLVKIALEYLDPLAQQAGQDASLQRELALAYQKVGDVQGNPTNANLGDSAGALVSYRKALAIVQKLLADHPEDASARRSLGVLHEKLSDLQAWNGDPRAGLENARAALAIFQAIADADPQSLKALQSVAISHIKLGDVLGHPDFPNVGDTKGALVEYQASLGLWRRLLTASAGAAPGTSPATPPSSLETTQATARRYLGLIHERIGQMFKDEGRIKEALASYQESLAIREAFAADHQTNTNARRDVAIGQEKIADVLMVQGDFAGALAQYRKSLDTFLALATEDAKNANASRSLTIALDKVGDALVKTGRVAEAIVMYRKSLAIREALSAADPNNHETRRDRAASYTRLGDASLRPSAHPGAGPSAEGWRQARSWYQKALEVWLDLQRAGVLRSGETGEPDRIAAKIKAANAAIQGGRNQSSH
jgi:eukaryotic-like serine/threonine-protein kinase